MTDRELLERFEDGTLPNESFHHEEHIRVAFLYLSEHSVLDSLERFSTGLRRFATRNGKAGLYHETITWAYILLIRERIARAEHKCTWREFQASNADLFDRTRKVLKKYYRDETLASDLAKSTFLFPDNTAARG
jgi:hypothetical protein